MSKAIELEQRFGAANYNPLPVVLTRGRGCHVWDEHGNKYLDMMGAYSAVSHGHAHPRLLAVLGEQASRLSVVSRAFHTDRLGQFLERACEVTGMDMALPMNTGAEAVETALKAARRWAYERKQVPADQAEVIVCEGNFHGRTLAGIAMSSEPEYRENFGPLPGGFRLIPFGDANALDSAITPNTAAFLVEPIQGEGGIVIPPDGYLARCSEICRRENVLLLCDEIQTGLGRTGQLLACHHDKVQPDGLLLGKALGGGILPVSLFLARRDVMELFRPGSHGSTFGGNPLAAAVAKTALDVLLDEDLITNSRSMGKYLLDGLRKRSSPVLADTRGRGLFIGMQLNPDMISARAFCERLMTQGILTKDTHATVVRLAPPLIIQRQEVDWALTRIEQVLREIEAQ
ncbi:MAG: ornithine--oxo-acid transaminase [Gammaproteobacteria bacterium]|nr:ornithine--oxo-acid transaminase [Gammaproteobacteria bacterium]